LLRNPKRGGQGPTWAVEPYDDDDDDGGDGGGDDDDDGGDDDVNNNNNNNNWLRTLSSTFCHRLKSAFFRCHNTPNNKNEVALL
jgi:hypothetical protein